MADRRWGTVVALALVIYVVWAWATHDWPWWVP
jgi:hypothetical protein